MKGSFSRLLESRADRIGVLLQQGRVLLDADWNLLSDIIDSRLRSLATDLIGVDGTAASADSLRIVARGGLDFTDAAGVGLSVPAVGPMADAIAAGGFTLEAIVRDTPDAIGTLIGGVSASAATMRLYITPEHELRFELGDASVQAALPGDGRHLHVAVVAERSVEDVQGLAPVESVWRIYIDGELAVESPPRAPQQPALRLTGLMIGALAGTVTGQGSAPLRARGVFRGQLSAVAMWMRPLESAEIRFSRRNWMRVPDSQAAERFDWWPLSEGVDDYALGVAVDADKKPLHPLWLDGPAGPGGGDTRQRAAWAAPGATLLPGRAYIGGLPAALDEAVPIDEQPDLVEPMPAAGRWVVYLEVFPREYGIYDDPDIAEVALGGADTTVRVRSVARARLFEGTASEWKARYVDDVPAKLRMSARWNGLGSVLSNDLYRVQVASAGVPYRTWPETAADDMSGLGTLSGATFTFTTTGGNPPVPKPSARVGTGAEPAGLLAAFEVGPTLPADPASATADPRTALYLPGRMAVMVFESGDQTTTCYTAITAAQQSGDALQSVTVDPPPAAIQQAMAGATGVDTRLRLFPAPSYWRVELVQPAQGPYTQVTMTGADAAQWPVGQLVKLFLGDDPRIAGSDDAIVEQAIVVGGGGGAPDPDDETSLTISLSPAPQQILDHIADRPSDPDYAPPVLTLQPLAALRWAVDNASTAYQARPSGAALRIVEQTGDALLPGNWVEVVRPEVQVARLPARVYIVSAVDDATDTVTLQGYDPGPDMADWAAGRLYLRRWFGRTAVEAAPLGVIPLDVRGDIPIEHGITVRFERNRNGALDVCDYWQIPTRTALPSGIEWQTLNDQPVPRPPMGPPVFRAPLAAMRIDGTRLALDDLRRRVMTTTDAFSYANAEQDGRMGIQLEAMPQMANMHAVLAALLAIDPPVSPGTPIDGPTHGGTPPDGDRPIIDSAPAGNPWRTSGIGERPATRARGALVDDTLWIFGDDGRWLGYDPGADAVTARGELPGDPGSPDATATGFAVAAIDDMIYLVGGGVGSGADRRLVSTVWQFDTGHRTFTRLDPVRLAPDQPIGTEDHALAALDGRLYLLGGTRLATGQAPATTVSDQILSWYPGASAWQVAGQLHQARCKAGAAVIGPQIYIVGGQIPDAAHPGGPPTALQDIELFQPVDDGAANATQGPTLVDARTDPGVAVIGTQLYVVGGIGATGDPLDSTEWLDTTALDPQFALLGVDDPPPGADPARLAALPFGGRIAPAALGRPAPTAGADAWLYVIGGAQTEDTGTLPGLMRPLASA